MAISEINKQSILLPDYKIVVNYKDDQGDTQVTRLRALEACGVNWGSTKFPAADPIQKVDFILGSSWSGLSKATSEITKWHNIPMLSASATADFLSDNVI
jgi:ABC-type branched-subunit amino acid transport system substrate-binding protein